LFLNLWSVHNLLYNYICVRSCIIIFMYNLRIIYQLNNSISSFFSTHLIISFQYALEEHHAGFKVLSSRLKKLENLLLSGNQCNDSIFPSLTGFSSLKSLDLSYNELTGSGIIHSFYLPKCLTWHSLNYIVYLSTKMRTLYLRKEALGMRSKRHIFYSYFGPFYAKSVVIFRLN
jgi:Leucine-rich repeat (LRR) protein